MPWVKREEYKHPDHKCELPTAGRYLAGTLGIKTGDVWVCEKCGAAYRVSIIDYGHDAMAGELGFGWEFRKLGQHERITDRLGKHFE